MAHNTLPPFDLERARAGDPVVDSGRNPVKHFHAIPQPAYFAAVAVTAGDGVYLVSHDGGCHGPEGLCTTLHMAPPPKQTAWRVSFGPTGTTHALWFRNDRYFADQQAAEYEYESLTNLGYRDVSITLVELDQPSPIARDTQP